MTHRRPRPGGRAFFVPTATILIALLPASLRAQASDCNLNGVLDADDLAAGTSADCDQNGVPDECDLEPLGFGFDAAVRYPSIGNASALATGDVDGDGRPDVVVASERDALIAVLLNRRGRLELDATFAAPGGPSDLVLADADGDGDLDVITADGEAVTVSVFANESGVFAAAVSYPTSGEARRLVAGDLDGVAGVDLAVTVGDSPFDGSVDVFLDTGGAFSVRDTLVAGAGASAIAIGDVVGDGAPDLVVTFDGMEEIRVFENRGSGSFAPASSAPATPALDLELGDLDGDGDLDIALADWGSLAVLRNDGGVLGPPELYPVPFADITALALADLDLDGDLDALETNAGIVPSLVVFLNDGRGAFALSATYAAGDPVDVAVADLDGDGVPDAITEDVQVLSGRGDGELAAIVRYELGSSLTSLAAHDLDGDGRPELVAGAFSGSLYLLQNRGDGLFLPPETISLGLEAEGPGVLSGAADLSGNGALDLYAWSRFAGKVAVILNQGDGTLDAPVALTADTYAQLQEPVDLEPDGDLDFLTVNTDPSAADVSVFRNRGDGAFEEADSYVTLGNGARGLVAVNLDADSSLDLAVTAGPAVAAAVWVFLGKGDGTFADPVSYAVPTSPLALIAAELSGDDLIDLAVAADQVAVLINCGDGAFGEAVLYPVGTAPVTLDAVDLDGDGDLDLLTVNRDSDDVSVLLNDGSGAFGTATSTAVGESPRGVIVADLDGDDRPDVVTENWGSADRSILLGDGSGAFRDEIRRDGFRGTQIADMDGDGDLDLVSSAGGLPSPGFGSVVLVYNLGAGEFSPEVFYPVGREPGGPLVARLDGDEALDIALQPENGEEEWGTLAVLLNRPPSAAADCNASGTLDLCDIEAGDSEDQNANGVPDECELMGTVTIAARPDSVISADGTRAIAFSGALDLAALYAGEDVVWNGASFTNVGPGDPHAVVRDCEIVVDANRNGALDDADTVIARARFEAGGNELVFRDMDRTLPPAGALGWFVVLELEREPPVVAAAVRPNGEGGNAALLGALAAAFVLVLAGTRPARRVAAAMSVLLLGSVLAVVIVSAPGCGGGGGGGGDTSPTEVEEVQLRLTRLDLSGADSGAPVIVTGLPLEAWPLEL